MREIISDNQIRLQRERGTDLTTLSPWAAGMGHDLPRRLLGAVRADDPETCHPFDDTRRYIDALELDQMDRDAVFSGNARRIYRRLDALLTTQSR